MEAYLNVNHSPGRSQVVRPRPATAPQAQRTRQPWEVYLLLGGAGALSALALIGNDPGLLPFLLSLLALGSTLALLLPPTAGSLCAFATVVAWVLLRQMAGVWAGAALQQSMAEAIGVGVHLVLALRFTRLWRRQQAELHQLQALRSVLVAGAGDAGLLPHGVAELRIHEEFERARLFQRPLGLLLIEVESRLGSPPVTCAADLDRALARQLVSTALAPDIPFQAGPTRLGMILPERGQAALDECAELIASALKHGRFLDQHGQTHALHHHIAFTLGAAVNRPEMASATDLLRAAEDALAAAHERNDRDTQTMPVVSAPAQPTNEPRPVGLEPAYGASI